MRRSLLLAFLGVALVLAWTPWADRIAEEYTDQSLKGAVVAFAVARSLNAVISLLKDSEINAGVGVSGTIAVGEILDPINDMVERFSQVAFTAVVALSLQKLLITVVGHGALNVLLTLAVLLLAALAWWPQWRARVPWLVVNGAMVLIALRFGMVVIAGLNEGFYQVFLEQPYEEAAQGLRATARQTAEQTGVPPPDLEEGATIPPRDAVDSTSMWASMKERIRQLTDLRAMIDRLESAIDHMTTMILVFVVNAMLLPLLLLWGFLKVLQWLWRLDVPPGSVPNAGPPVDPPAGAGYPGGPA